VGALALQVARAAMSVLLRLNSEESRHVRNSHVEDVGAAAGRDTAREG